MNELLDQMTPTLITAFIAILVAFIGYIGKVIVKLVPIVIEHIVAKIGLSNYQKTRLIALDAWNKIEEDGRLGKLANSKIVEFENIIKTRVPGITDAEIELVRQAIAGEINKDKPVIQKAIEEPTIVTAAPIIKYYAADGVTELKPVQ